MPEAGVDLKSVEQFVHSRVIALNGKGSIFLFIVPSKGVNAATTLAGEITHDKTLLL